MSQTLKQLNQNNINKKDNMNEPINNADPEEGFWRNVVGKSDSRPETIMNFDNIYQLGDGNQNGESCIKTESGLKNWFTKMKTQGSDWIKNNEIVKFMLIFFSIGFIFTFFMFFVFNPPLVQVNKGFNKSRSILKILGFSLLFSVIAAILVPISIKCWNFFKQKNPDFFSGSNGINKQSFNFGNDHQMHPALEVVSL